MGSRVEDLQALARMLDEGQITTDEYEVVKAELLAAPATEWDTPDGSGATVETAASDAEVAAEPVEVSSPVVTVDGDVEPEPAPDEADEGPPTLWQQIRSVPRRYLAAGGVALAAMFLAAAVFGDPPPQTVDAPPISTDPAQSPPPEDSLGVRFDTLAEEWNRLAIPPTVRRGISVTPEAGPLDGFLYRFDDSAVLAGAYDPGDGHVRAIMVRAGLFHPDLGNLYVHLCHLLHPNDQGCLDTYIEEAGVYGATVSEYAGVDHEASWVYQDNLWSFTLVDDIQTIRVQAPGQG